MKKRRFSNEGVMHVYQRTIEGFNLFYSMEDFLVFYTIVAVKARQYGICLFGLCLMIDHIHLLLHAMNLSMMSRFISAYTSLFVREFNTRTGRTGSLFDTPYGSALKLELKNIRSAIAYLFNNPVEKQLCRKAEQYRWNFLAYYDTESPVREASCRKRLKRSMRIAKESYEHDRHLNYRLLGNLMNGLPPDEKEQLTDYIIQTYFPFDSNKTISHYGSYAGMLTAINSNTGSEYDIQESWYCRSDRPYGEMISFLRKNGYDDMHKVLTLPMSEKINMMNRLKRMTSASYAQIKKFLHMESNS